MSVQKIVIYVTEKISHKVEIELEEDEINSLIEDLNSVLADDFAGDLCSSSTMQDGEWEMEEYEVIDK
jgi:hypothetical protein